MMRKQNVAWCKSKVSIITVITFIIPNSLTKSMQKHAWRRAQISNKSQSLPIPRWGHSCCVIGEEVVFFGGYADSNYMNDVWSFNTVSMTWAEIKTTGDIPSNRSNCSMNYDRENNRIVVFGGGGSNKKRFNSINILDWSTKDWLEITPKENQNAPWERTYHSAELVFPYLIVYGGQGIADMDDLWVFNFLTLSWTEVPIDKSKGKPCARRFHSSAIVGNQFYVIAGCHGKYRPLNDVYSLDLTPLLETGKVDSLEWKQRKFKGSAFLTRWGQSSCVYDNKIYIFGGRFSSDLNDILVIDIEKETMKTLKTGIESPKPRRRHCACFVGSCMIVFGGFNGEYFNDLFFVNVFQLKSKLQIPANNKNQLYLRFVGQNHLSDSSILSYEKEIIPVHKGLIVNAFPNKQTMESFLTNIEGVIPKQDLTQILTCLYQGYGILPSAITKQYSINLPTSQEQKDKKSKDQINQMFSNENRSRQSLVRRPINNSSPVIKLQDTEFSQFLEKQRQPQFSSLTIVVNKQCEIRVNGAQLALSSTYFANLLSGRYSDLDESSKLQVSLPHNNVIIFQIMLNYLLMDYVVVPLEMTDKDWTQLCTLAETYCLGRLLSICEQQLCQRVSEDNFVQMMEFALDLEMDILALWCADYQIKLMVSKEEVYQEPVPESAQMKAKKEFVLKMVYEMLRFDILQTRLERDRLLDGELRKKESSSTADEKENYEINCNQ